MNLKNISLPFLGFLQATALVAYILAVASLMNFIGDKLPDEDTVLSPVAPILLFVVSAVISAGIVLGRAGQLFVLKKQPEAYRLVGWTVAWALAYFGLFVVYLISA